MLFRSKTIFNLEPDPMLRPENTLSGCLIIPGWLPKQNGVPLRHTCFSLLHDVDADLWVVAHYYASEQFPLSKRRCVFALKDPVCKPTGGPLLGVGYNHLCWIEQNLTHRISRRPTKRVLKLATYPEPDDYLSSGAPEVKIRSINVNSQILDSAALIAIVVGLGSIVIMTDTKDVHRFQFA